MNLREVSRPRVRFDDVPQEVRPYLEGVCGGHESWGASREDIYEADFDLVVTFDANSATRSSLGLNVLSFGAHFVHYWSGNERGSRRRDLSFTGRTLARRVSVAETSLVKETGWSKLLGRSVADHVPHGEKQFWEGSATAGFTAGRLVEADATSGTGAIACLVKRGWEPGAGEILLLPSYTTDHRAWLIAFLERLRAANPAAFPARPDWRRREEWASAPMLTAMARRDDLVTERERATARLDAQIIAADGLVQQEASRAGAGPQRLLSTQGEALVEAVAEALAVIGFEVRDMDAEKSDGQARLEDLRLADREVPGWEALVEVKGYTRGAKAGDVGPLVTRKTRAYVEETGNFPGQVLLIVNANLGQDPSERDVGLGNDDTAIVMLAEGQGAFVDTRDLFRAVRAVEQGLAAAGDVRASIRRSRGRWESQH